tara:strand:+ start:1893 stop:2450 length:558 start_codon:yes stop_codon:yes gene_type:complete
MKKYYFLIFFFFLLNESSASVKNDIIKRLNLIENISFNFEQNINDKIEKGKCILQYPKKIFCEYDLSNKKILVSNGKSFVIKTISSYYIYPLKKTSLDLILDKKYLLDKISKSKDYYSDKNIIAFKFFKDENEINLFFDKKSLNLKGWQTVDLYQNLNIVYLSSILINQKIEKKKFELPSSNLKD